MQRKLPTRLNILLCGDDWRLKLAATVIALLCVLQISTTEAAVDQSLQAEYESAYQAVYDEPENYTHAWRFVIAAKRLGTFDAYETAIGVLEPILLVDQDQQLIRSEVGLLYYRLGAYAAAKAHLQEALDSGKLSREREAVVKTALSRSKRQTQRNRLTGAVTAGIRYQSNPSFVSDSDTVTFQDTQLQLAAVPQPDGDANFFLSSWFRHQYDLDLQNEATFDTSASLYFTQQFDQTEDDILSFAAAPGLSFKPFRRNAPWLRLRPHFYGNVLTIGDDLYALSYGGGIDVIGDVSDRVRTQFTYQRRQRDFRATADRPFAEFLDGAENHYQVKAIILLPRRFSLNVRGLGIQSMTESDFRDNWLWAVAGQLNYRYEPPVGWGDSQWRAWLRVVGEFRAFDAPNPILSATEERNDQRVTVAVGNSANIYRSLDLNFEYLVQNQDSDFNQFEFINHSGLVSLTYRY